MTTVVVESSNTVLQQSDASSVVVAPSDAGTLIQTGLMGPISAGSDRYYRHDQTSAASTWTITHMLDKYPSVTIVDSAGDEVEGSVNHISTSTLEITFSAPFSGRAYLN